MVWKGYYNAIHFSIISNFYVNMHLFITNLDMFKLGYLFTHSVG